MGYLIRNNILYTTFSRLAVIAGRDFCFINLHKNINTYLCNIPYCNLDTNGYNNKREEEIKMKHTLTREKILDAISVLETVVDVLKVISEHMKNEQNDDSNFVESAD